MLDRWTMVWVKPGLQKTAAMLENTGITASQISVSGFLIGMTAVPFLWHGMFAYALAVILVNRLLDGLDGAMARLKGPTDAGAFLDITLDFIFYSAVAWGFALADPAGNGLAAATLVFSFVGTGSSFLAFASMAAKQGITNVQYPQKSLYYLGGLAEGTETIAVFVLFCLLPGHFPVLAYCFAAVCWLTTLLRIYGGYRTLKAQEGK